MAMPLVFGTAGHIDHGKSSLVRALTGIDPDRLQEEKARGITIELGFAYLDVPGLGRVSLIDVPGHERFVRQMVAGAQGIDAVLLVIAADEGVMPQTREHLDICRLLGVRAGLIVLSKADLVEAGFLELAAEDARAAVRGTFLAEAPILPVSALRRDGLDALLQSIGALGRALPARATDGVARLPVDRVFTLKGFGTVVTGTLLAGRLSVGDSVDVHTLSPRGPVVLPAKIRTMQVHNQPVESAQGGQRLALCLSGIERQDVERGATVAAPGVLRATRDLDVRLLHVPHDRRPLPHRAAVHFHMGTTQARARVLLLDEREIAPGGEALARIKLDRPVVTLPGERFIVRGFLDLAGHGRTLGGGEILDAHPLTQQRRALLSRSLSPIARAMEQGSREELLLAHLRRAHFAGISAADLVGATGLGAGRVERVLQDLGARRLVRRFDVEGQRYAAKESCEDLARLLRESVRAYHELHPMRPGIPREELRSRIPAEVPQKLFARVLEDESKAGELELNGETVRARGFTPRLGDASRVVALLRHLYADAALTPPKTNELELLLATKGERASPAVVQESLALLKNEKALVKVSDDLWFDASVLDELKQRLIAYLREQGNISPQRWKEMVGTTRKYSIPLAEYFDKERITLRVGDERRLRPGAA
jgi:selenocysteine-specific elongation factor